MPDVRIERLPITHPDAERLVEEVQQEYVVRYGGRDDVLALGSKTTAEIKRMYVAQAARGKGLARLMLAHLEAAAVRAGAPVMVLETGIAQPEAIALYESSGYVRIDDFGYYKDAPLSRCYARRLADL